MYDDKDERSSDVCYDLKFQKNGEYLLKITADASWINSEDRAYPVKIDPTVTTDYFIFDSYTSSASPNTNYGRADKLWISTTADTYIYMSIPELPEGSIINNAYLNVAYYFNVSTGSLMACAYRITGSWDEDTITYNNAPSYSRTAPGTNYFYASSSINSTSPGRAYFTITNAVRNWYNNGSTSGYQTGTNFGIVLKRISNSNHTNSSVILISYEGDYDNCANISINYFPKAPISDGIYQIKSAYSGYYMQVYGKGTSVGTTIQQNVNMYEDHQQFLIKSEDNGEYTIRPIHALDKALSVADMHTGTVATLANYNPNSPNQRFKISLTDNGKYVISTRISDYEKALVVTNGSDLAGQTISQCEYNSSTQWHNWILEFAGPESGVFSFKSYNSLYYMVSNSHTHGEFVPKSFFEDSPTLSKDIEAFFKIIYRPSSQDYVIRNMVDNSVVIYPGSIRPYSTDEICADINDADVSANYTWRISKAGTNSYYIWYQQSDSSPKKYLNISSVDDYLTLTETRVLATRWVLNRSYESMRKIEYNNTLSHIIESGDSIDLNDYFENCTYRSTYIGDNEPGGAVSYSVSDISESPTSIASVTSSGIVNTVSGKAGVFLATTTFTKGVSLKMKCYVEPTSTTETCFFLQNIQTSNGIEVGFVDINNNGASKELFSYDDTQVWKMIPSTERIGYYYIKNIGTDQYLSSPASTSTDVAIDLVTIASGDSQLWSITETPSGAYKIRSRRDVLADRNLYLNIKSSSNNTLVQDTFVQNSSYLDEFNIIKFGDDVVYNRTLAWPTSIDPSGFTADLSKHYSSFKLIHSDINMELDEAKEILSYSKIMIINGHGSPQSINIHDFAKVKIKNVNIYDPENVEDSLDLSGTDIVIFAGCSTGGNPCDYCDQRGKHEGHFPDCPDIGSIYYNMPKSAEMAGAKVAIGWSVIQTDNHMNDWIDCFFELMNSINTRTDELYTAYEAFIDTNDYITNENAKQAVIYGNCLNFRLSD